MSKDKYILILFNDFLHKFRRFFTFKIDAIDEWDIKKIKKN
jgi:hypothetical protein